MTYKLIQRVVTSNNTSSVSLNNLPQDYLSLKIMFYQNGKKFYPFEPALRLNNNSGAVYKFTQWQIADNTGFTGTDRTFFYLTKNSIDVDNEYFFEIDLIGYTNNRRKKVMVRSNDQFKNTRMQTIGSTESTSAVSSVQIFCVSGSLPNGTVITVWGV